MIPALESVFPIFTDFKKIGQGNSGSAYSARHKKLGFEISIKQIAKADLVSKKRENFFNEMSLLYCVDHPFLPQFFDLVETPDYYFVLNELIPNGSLLDLVSQKKFTYEECQAIFAQVASAVYYLHTVMNSVHRDIKLEHILFDKYSNAHLIDFGLSKILYSTNQGLHTICGSYPYVAPEIFQKIPYGKPVDIWSLGVCLYSIAVGRFPFSDSSIPNLINKICNQELRIPSRVHPIIADLLTKMLCKDPSKRITIQQISLHPFISETDSRFFFTQQFYFGEEYKVKLKPMQPPNAAVVAEMEKSGYNPCKITEPGSEESIIYKVLRKMQIVEMMKVKVKNLPRSSVLRKDLSLNDLQYEQQQQEIATAASESALLSNKLAVRRRIRSFRGNQSMVQVIPARCASISTQLSPQLLMARKQRYHVQRKHRTFSDINDV
ncbi:CAMK family protein kinase [Histomonas meleagridis]|uniref:CAMK family protein kinase n=1 Tax=Histomonas meleagridis TaxID=135588 RepID=UPI00355A8CDD|nr:CAMK family protein kinase [Histomonas meleagridis]KAH0801433.1 CAMK family protein kinase [Histomonas meleagridis]